MSDATQVCHNTMAHPATLVAVALHHLEVESLLCLLEKGTPDRRSLTRKNLQSGAPSAAVSRISPDETSTRYSGALCSTLTMPIRWYGRSRFGHV